MSDAGRIAHDLMNAHNQRDADDATVAGIAGMVRAAAIASRGLGFGWWTFMRLAHYAWTGTRGQWVQFQARRTDE